MSVMSFPLCWPTTKPGQTHLDPHVVRGRGVCQEGDGPRLVPCGLNKTRRARQVRNSPTADPRLVRTVAPLFEPRSIARHVRQCLLERGPDFGLTEAVVPKLRHERVHDAIQRNQVVRIALLEVAALLTKRPRGVVALQFPGGFFGHGGRLAQIRDVRSGPRLCRNFRRHCLAKVAARLVRVRPRCVHVVRHQREGAVFLSEFAQSFQGLHGSPIVSDGE